MRGKEFGYQVGAEKIFSIKLKVLSQEVDLPRKEDPWDRAAGAAIFARFEVLFEILVDNFLPGIFAPDRTHTQPDEFDYRSNGLRMQGIARAAEESFTCLILEASVICRLVQKSSP